ncbi:ABC transporter substrate-binding protein [Devosia naphthalenivorans]|uniref:ABC transporter substrate-binding protein n=1 Tax=Devosia naphthalenivorans TaxID=2082392 RepID=UPI0013B04B38|nr:ABC transporter substrate-binding protein [Devosia naphthalenivorans]
MTSLRHVAAAAGLFAASLLMTSAAFSLDELRLAVADTELNPTTDSVLTLADSLGLFEKHGLKINYVALSGTPQAVAALNSGAVDLAHISIDAAVRLRADNNLPIRGIVAVGLGIPYLIAAKDDVKSVEDLVGKSFAIADNGSLDHTLTQTVLNSMGVDTNGPNYVPVGSPSARVQALAAGRVDATTASYGSFLPVANTPGIHVLVAPEDFYKAAPVQSKFVAALEGTLTEKYDPVQRFVLALNEASRAFADDPAKWVDFLAAGRDDLTREDLIKTVDSLEGRWCVNGCMNTDLLQVTMKFLYEGPDFAGVKAISLDDIVDLRFIAGATEQLGAYRPGGLDAL